MKNNILEEFKEIKIYIEKLYKNNEIKKNFNFQLEVDLIEKFQLFDFIDPNVDLNEKYLFKFINYEINLKFENFQTFPTNDEIYKINQVSSFMNKIFSEISENFMREIKEFNKINKITDVSNIYNFAYINFYLTEIRNGKNINLREKENILQFFKIINLTLNGLINDLLVIKAIELFDILNNFNSSEDLGSSNNVKAEINILNEKLKSIETKNKENIEELESERQEKETILAELEEKNRLLEARLKNETEEVIKDIERNKIQKAIIKLNTNSYELNEERKKFIENRDNFKSYALDIFKITIFIFIFMTFYLHFFSDINSLDKEISIGYYLIHSFPILFPTLIGFLFLRQSNINAKELNKINRRFTLTHDIRASLEALVEINSPEKMQEKAEKVIDKLIDNILDYANENNQTEKEKIDVLEFNEKLDKIIDTLDKKKTVFNILNK